MLANGHNPFDTRIFHKEAKSLFHAGFTVSIIAPADKDEVREGIGIFSVPVYRKGLKKLITLPWLIYKRALKQPKDSWFQIHDSEVLWIGILLKLRGRKVIYDAHEDTPLQIAYQHWIPKILRKPYAGLYFLIEKLCGFMFDGIIVAEPVIAKYFPVSKTILIRNFPVAEPFVKHPENEYINRNMVLVYVGLLSKVRGMIKMAEGASIAKKQIEFEFVIGGSFSPSSLQQEVLDNYPVKFLSWVPFEKLVDLLFESRIGIIVPNPVPRYKTNYPVKLFEYMAASLPVIASKYGEAAEFVKEAGAGLLVDPMNPQEIADAIVWLLRNPAEAEAMGKQGRKKILESWNWENESRLLIDFYNGHN